jgi:hypothetical protein
MENMSGMVDASLQVLGVGLLLRLNLGKDLVIRGAFGEISTGKIG